MSDSTTIIDPQELRPLIHQTLDALGEANLAAVDELLLEVDRVAGELDPINSRACCLALSAEAALLLI